MLSSLMSILVLLKSNMKIQIHLRCLLFAVILFNFSLSWGQKRTSFHQAAILIDAHNDFPSAAIGNNLAFDQDLRGRAHSDLRRMKTGGVDIQIFSIFCGPEQTKPFAWANREIDSVFAWVERNPDDMRWVRNSKELKKAVKQKKIGTMLGVEGGHMIEDRLENLEALYNRGVRYLTLTWNNSTAWASSALDETTLKDTTRNFGLNQFGQSVVRKMNELGMLVDVSHNGERTFWDAMATTTKPVIASHSSVYNLCPHRRNLKDDQIKAIAHNGGVIHVNFYAGFIDSTYEKKSTQLMERHRKEMDSLTSHQTASTEITKKMLAEKHAAALLSIRPSISILLDHLDYIVKLVGVDHVGLGSDFDGIEAPPLELQGVEDFPKITDALLERGYAKKDIRKILGGNYMRVLKANEKK